MLRFAIDENFNDDIVRGLLRRQPNMDVVRVREANLSGADDPAVLDWAAREGRVLITHDVTTMTRFAFDRIQADEPMPGVFAVSRGVPIRLAIEELLLIAECSQPGEWEGQVRYLPLR